MCSQKDIQTQGLEVIIASNPRNPTGQVIQNGELQSLVSVARDTQTTLILDEVRATVVWRVNVELTLMVNVIALYCAVLLLVHLSRERIRVWQVDLVCEVH